MFKPDLGVLAFIHGSFHEDFGNLLIAFFASYSGKVVVLVAGLRFACKGSPEVLFGLSACKLIGHFMFSFISSGGGESTLTGTGSFLVV